MKRKTLLLTMVGILLFMTVSSAQQQELPPPTQQAVEIDVQVTYAEYLGKVPPIRELAPVPSTNRDRRKRSKRPVQVPPNFSGRRLHPVVAPELQYHGPDPLRQWNSTKNGDTIVVEPIVNTDGLISGFSPTDPTGDIGLEYYLQAINVTDMGVFTKEGDLVQAFAANTIWSQLGFSSAGDPIVLFDQEAQRWIMTEFPSGNQLLVAISETNDPLGSWSAYNFATPSFPDYPKYGIWGNAYSVTTNEGGAGQLEAYFIQREALLAGEDMVPIQRITVMGSNNSIGGFLVAAPANWVGDIPSSDEPIILALNDSSWGMAPQDQIEMYEVKLNWANPDLTQITNTSLPTTPFDAHACASPGAGFACIPQQNGGGIDGIPEIIMNQPIYRNFQSHESIVLNHMTDVDGNDLSGIRWVELRRTPGEGWAIYQEGTYAPDDGLHRFMGSIAIDRQGNIGLAYNVSSENSFAGVRFTGRRASDSLGIMTVAEYNVIEGASAMNFGGRFGDYAHMSVDPINGRTFWHTTEYAGSGGQARTRIVAFELGKDSTDLVAARLVTPTSGSDLTTTETAQLLVLNDGINTIDSFTVGLEFAGNFLELDTVQVTLASDSTYLHTFDTTLDLSTLGDYELRLFVNTVGDDFIRNDTLRSIISNLPRNDVGIRSIEVGESTVCGAEFAIAFIIENQGTAILQSAMIEWTLNGEPQEPINWTGSLSNGQSEAIELTITNAQSGTNVITATATLPNGQADERPENNASETEVDVLPNGATLNLNLQMDLYPEDISWEVRDDSGVVLLSGGNYGGAGNENTLVTEELCLDADGCYTFEIFDSFGDGLCCAEGNGSYSISDEEGLPLLTSNGEFGFGEVREFCATFMCMLDFDVEVSPSTPLSDGGTIMIIFTGGTGPFAYSINGGQSFAAENTFTGLAPGDYDVFVRGAGNCTFETTVTVTACNLDASFSIVNESTTDAADGSITVTATGGVGDLVYTLNGVEQDGAVFTDLPGGEYEITVSDGQGCLFSQTVTVGVLVNTDDVLVVGEFIRLYPNPTDGVFQLEVVGMEARDLFLPLEVYDVRGRRLYQSQIPQYNGQYRGALSLYAYPSGTYYLRVLDDRLPGLIQVIKE